MERFYILKRKHVRKIMDVLRGKYNFDKVSRKNVHKKCKFRGNGGVF